MTTDIQLNVTDLEHGVYTRILGFDEIEIVCNWCEGHVVFYSGEYTRAPGSGYLKRAAIHLNEEHKGRKFTT